MASLYLDRWNWFRSKKKCLKNALSKCRLFQRHFTDLATTIGEILSKTCKKRGSSAVQQKHVCATSFSIVTDNWPPTANNAERNWIANLELRGPDTEWKCVLSSEKVLAFLGPTLPFSCFLTISWFSYCCSCQQWVVRAVSRAITCCLAAVCWNTVLYLVVAQLWFNSRVWMKINVGPRKHASDGSQIDSWVSRHFSK